MFLVAGGPVVQWSHNINQCWSVARKAMASQKKIVVIGNGGAGSRVAAQLAKNKSNAVTVITPFEYMEISLCMTKVVASGAQEHSESLHSLLREDGVQYVIDSVSSLGDQSITTTAGHSIPYDACVIAVGQQIPIFMPDSADRTADMRKATIAKVQEQIKHAHSVIISGGGPIGCEAAADIKLRNKDKKVTIVHSHREVLNGMNDPFQLAAHARLEKIGVDIVLSERIVQVADGSVTLSSGKTLPCDFHLPCHAVRGNAGQFLKNGSADDRGYAKVNDTFKVDGYEKVFAIGDCSNYDPIKIFPRIDDQMPVLLHNVQAVAHGDVLKHHVRMSNFMGQLTGPAIVALGHNVEGSYGIGPDLPGTCLPFCCWFCCCCSTPAGSCVANSKANFNKSITPKKGLGIH